MMCVLRTASESFDVDGFLQRYPHLHPDVVWHKGERQGNKLMSGNGFNLFITEGPNWPDVLRSTLDFCRSNAAALQDARAATAGLELDFKVEAGEGRRFTVEALFAPDDLRELVATEAALCVTVYLPSRT